ncbi:NAD(P)-dependent oxidoreductase [Bacteroidota bacterium]
MKNKTIGWIGTGVMGKSMLMHYIRNNYICNVYNRTKDKAEELIQNGAKWCNNPADIANKSDIIFSIVGYPEDVEKVYFGENGIFKGNVNDKITIDMTTTKPSLALNIYNEAKKNGASSIDAPVSGGDVGAKNGTLSIMAGGDKDAFDKIKPLFDIIGKNIVYQGKAGSGQHTKMCNQITIAGTMIGVCESLLYGYKAGLNLETMLSSISKGAAGCWSLDNLAPRIINKDFEPGFFVEHFIKDMGIALEEAHRMKLSLPGLKLVKEIYDKSVEYNLAKKGTQALYLILDKVSNR